METQTEQKEKTIYICNLCHHFWYSKLEHPKTCPRCKRYDYDKEKKNERQQTKNY